MLIVVGVVVGNFQLPFIRGLKIHGYKSPLKKMNQLNQKIISKKHRLEKQNYIGKNFYYLTICCFNRDNYFTAEKNVVLVKDILFNCAHKYNFKILLAMFMPEHLHIVLSGKNDDSDLLKFINMLKKVSTYKFGKKLWQESFWDHIIRDEKNLTKIIRYVLENPVRKGLASDFSDWKYVFLEEYDLVEFGNVFYDEKTKIVEL